MSGPAPSQGSDADAPPASAPRPPHEQGDLWADDGTSRAEIQIEGDRLEVTFALPDLDPKVLEHFVGSNVLILWSREAPETQRTLVRLPVDVRPDTSVARFNNGVFDLTALVADAADASDAHPDVSPPDGSA